MTSAFDMFKTSGAMRLIEDKDLLQGVWDCYALLEQAKPESEHYMQGKSELTQELMAKKEAVNVELDIRRSENRPLLIFYNNRVDASLKEMFDRCAGQTEQTLKQF